MRGLFRTRSIRYILKIVFIAIISCFIFSYIVNLLYARQITMEYGRQISNIEFANNLSNVVQEQTSRECWNIVAGRQSFAYSNIYETLDSIDNDLIALHSNTYEDGQELVEAAMRANGTLRGYVDRLSEQCENNVPVSMRQMTLNEINNVSENIYDVLQQFAYTQINAIARVNADMQSMALTVMLMLALLGLAVIALAFAAYRVLREALDRPNKEIAAMADRIIQGDLQTVVPPPGQEDLNKLVESINRMSEHIKALLDNSIEEQKNLQKAELRALQAQIAPHFLYNTFDTIVWLAQGGYTDEVVEITMAFSNYYRIALSRGRDFITVGEEVAHVRAYLTIQGMRYKNKLQYEINVDEAIMNHSMLKLLLQPIVENALYHGIKNRRKGGAIQITGRELQDGSLYFSVADNGMGMKEETLTMLQKEIAADDLPETSGYGLYNVNKRIKLYYAAADMKVESAYGEGTTVSFILPNREEQKDDVPCICS